MKSRVQLNSDLTDLQVAFTRGGTVVHVQLCSTEDTHRLYYLYQLLIIKKQQFKQIFKLNYKQLFAVLRHF